MFKVARPHPLATPNIIYTIAPYITNHTHCSTHQVFGHRNVSILDGGYQKWQEEGHPVNTNAPPIFIPTEYKAQFRAELVKGMGDVVQALREGKVQVGVV